MAAPRKPRATATPGPPHSWEVDSWPEGVWPHDPGRGRWIARAYRRELIASGALTRIGYKIVFLGTGYARWLESRAPEVAEYKSNNPQIGAPHAATAIPAGSGEAA